MGERKVLNKYFPPDFDPRKIVRRRRPKNGQMNVRIMLPMTLRCNCCRNFIYRGTKFNSRKEDVIGESYLGIQEFGFYLKCSSCSAEITLRTDPRNSDYVVESGATRNFEPWRAEEEEFERLKRIKVAEGMDALKLLENKAADSKRELDVIAALDEVISLKSRQEKVGVDALLRVLQHQADKERKRKLYDEDDEALIRAVFGGGERSSDQEGHGFVRRIEEEEDDDDSEEEFKTKAKRRKPDQTVTATLARAYDGSKFIIKKKPLPESNGGNKARKGGETNLQKMQEWMHGNCEEDVESMSSQQKLQGQDKLGEKIMERPIILHMPCLRLVRMKNYRETKSELYVVELLKKSKVVLEKICSISGKRGKNIIPSSCSLIDHLKIILMSSN